MCDNNKNSYLVLHYPYFITYHSACTFSPCSWSHESDDPEYGGVVCNLRSTIPLRLDHKPPCRLYQTSNLPIDDAPCNIPAFSPPLPPPPPPPPAQARPGSRRGFGYMEPLPYLPLPVVSQRNDNFVQGGPLTTIPEVDGR